MLWSAMTTSQVAPSSARRMSSAVSTRVMAGSKPSRARYLATSSASSAESSTISTRSEVAIVVPLTPAVLAPLAAG